MARQRLGQHFLVRDSILRRIAHAACPEHEPLVIEIGPGKGALTRHLLEFAGHVVAIELDSGLATRLRSRFTEERRLELIEGDVLDADLTRWGPSVIVGNLPYYISSAILSKVLPLGPLLKRAVFLVQNEVARRIAAQPGGREYGYLTTEASLYAVAELLFSVSASAFDPPPNVESAVVRLTPRPEDERWGIRDPEAFLRFARLCFRQKRKMLRNNLAGAYPKSIIDGLPEATLRAEQIPISQLAGLYQRLTESVEPA